MDSIDHREPRRVRGAIREIRDDVPRSLAHRLRAAGIARATGDAEGIGDPDGEDAAVEAPGERVVEAQGAEVLLELRPGGDVDEDPVVEALAGIRIGDHVRRVEDVPDLAVEAADRELELADRPLLVDPGQLLL